MNRNDYQSGWDTDQFPNNVPEMALAYYEVLRAGGFTTGGTNFDAKVGGQSLDPEDLILAHVGAMDCCAAGSRRGADAGGRASSSRRARSAMRAGTREGDT
jgi:xylose isomerase